jgi:hypothetical protein
VNARSLPSAEIEIERVPGAGGRPESGDRLQREACVVRLRRALTLQEAHLRLSALLRPSGGGAHTPDGWASASRSVDPA